MTTLDVTDLFCKIDDFFLPALTSAKITRTPSLHPSEIATILNLFSQSHYDSLKHFYLEQILDGNFKSYFPHAVSYKWFNQLIPTALLPLCLSLDKHRGEETGLYVVDSSAIEVCHIKRASSHKVFKGFASKSKSTKGWFFGFKLHLLINHIGELMSFKISPATTDDRKTVLSLAEGLIGLLLGDRGYISEKLKKILNSMGLKLMTKLRKNMKKTQSEEEEIMLKKRGLVESVLNILKSYFKIEHTRHRNPLHAFINILSGLLAYQMSPKKPCMKGVEITKQSLLDDQNGRSVKLAA